MASDDHLNFIIRLILPRILLRPLDPGGWSAALQEFRPFSLGIQATGDEIVLVAGGSALPPWYLARDLEVSCRIPHSMYIFIAKTNVGDPVSRALLESDLKDSTQHCSFAGTHRHGPHMAVGLQNLAGAICPQSSVDWT